MHNMKLLKKLIQKKLEATEDNRTKRQKRSSENFFILLKNNKIIKKHNK